MTVTKISMAGLAAMVLFAASAQATTYVASRAVGTGTVDLSITTDGTLGTLATANIIGWTITVEEGADSFTLKPDNSAAEIFGTAVSATATDLSFDFAAPGLFAAFIIQTPSVGSGQPLWCLQTTLCYNLEGPGEGILPRFDNFNSSVSTDYAGNVIFASAPGTPAIPEPASWALMIAGFGLVGSAMRRRRPATA